LAQGIVHISASGDWHASIFVMHVDTWAVPDPEHPVHASSLQAWVVWLPLVHVHEVKHEGLPLMSPTGIPSRELPQVVQVGFEHICAPA
jgi:hypothetical protein